MSACIRKTTHGGKPNRFRLVCHHQPPNPATGGTEHPQSNSSHTLSISVPAAGTGRATKNITSDNADNALGRRGQPWRRTGGGKVHANGTLGTARAGKEPGDTG